MEVVTTRDWPKVTIEEVALDVTVGHVGPMADEYLEAGVPFLRSLSVERFGIREEGLKFISPDFHKKLKKSALVPGDVVIVRTGKPGTCAVVPNWLGDANCSDLVIVRCGPRVRPHFLCYIVNSIAGDHIDAHTVGAVQQHFNVGSARTLSFLLPPIDEQDRILALLRGLDGKIELNRKMNTTLEAMARALFRDWFVDFGPTRAKIEARAPYLSPDLWSLFPDRLDDEGKPEGWAYEPLLDLAEWVNGAAYKNMHFSDAPDALPVIKIAELKSGVTGNTQRTATDLGPRYLINDGELLFSWSGNPDTSIDTFLWTGGKAWLNQHIFAVRQNGKRSKPYLHALLKFLKPEFAELARNKQTTGLGHVTKADMQRMMVCAASSEVLQAFDRLIEPIFYQALGLQTETRTLAQTRELLLPRLMSGELRVADLASFDQEAVA